MIEIYTKITNKHIRIQSTPECYTLTIHDGLKETKSGKNIVLRPSNPIVKHYPTLESLIKGLIELNIRLSNAKTMKELASVATFVAKEIVESLITLPIKQTLARKGERSSDNEKNR